MSGMPFLVYYSSEVKNMKPTAAKTVSSQLIYRNHGRKAASFFILLILACAATCASAATYYWKSTSASEPASASLWTALSNWSTESESGADATALPGASDDIYDKGNGVWRSFDLEDGEWSISGWKSAYSDDWFRHYWRFRNGTLHWVGAKNPNDPYNGQNCTHSDTIHLDDGASFIMDAGSYYCASFNHGATDEWRIHAGASLSMLGEIQIYNVNAKVDDGGVMVFAPSPVYFYSGTAQCSYLQNSGILAITNGISFTKGASNGTFEIRQLAGTLTLGGVITKNGQNGTYKMLLSGGTVCITGDVSTDFDTSVSGTVTFETSEGAALDANGFSYAAGAVVTKTGVGDFVFTDGMPLADSFTVAEGGLRLPTSGTYDISGVTFSSGGKVKIGAMGVTLTDWDPSLLNNGGFVADIAVPVVGSTVFSCANADVLALAKSGLDATLPDGFAVTINGNSLVVTSAYVFDSTTVTDLNDPAGWAGGAVPSNKVVTIKGAGVSPTTTDLPPFAGMTIMDGASLVIANGGTIPSLALSDSATLTISSGVVTIGSAPTISPAGANRPSVTVASGATLNVPGATTFTDCSLSVSGTLATVSTGDLVLGYAAAGDSASFGLSVNGGTLSTTAGDIRFFCPASGGTVSPLGVVAFTGATFEHDNDHGFFFGVNNPASEAVNFIFDGTTLNYPKRGYYTISGGAALSFVNGGSLYRANNQNEKFTLTVSGLASIILGEGTSSLIGESSSSGGSVGNGAMTFSPDTDGFASLVISNATWETYHSAGNGKAVAEIYGNSVHTINQNNYNRAQPFDGFKAVNLNADAMLTISNNVDAAGLDFSEKFTGAGSLFFSTPRSTTRTFNFKSTTSTATGTLAADPAKNDALVIAPTATWGGTVVWNGKASISHSSTAGAMTFGGIDLASDFTYRIWGDGTCDHYTLSGEGFVDNGGKIVITVADGSEAEPGDLWILARVPAGTAVPTSAGASWTIAAREVDGDDSVVDIVLSPVASDYTFESTEFCDLTAADGWSCGYVPTNENVKVTGAGVVATISSAAAFPTFASIAVRNGATLKVLADVTLPPLTVDATSKVVFGDNETAVAATLDATLVTGYDATTEPVSLPVIEVATNATLTVAAGMKFRNVDFRLYGTITKPSTSDVSPVFGYADNGETSYIAFAADGGTFDFHSDQVVENGSVSIVCPASGGTVVSVGTIILRNSRRLVTGWADFGNWQFGVNNPTSQPFNVLIDGTHLDCSAYFYAAGAANLSLENGARIRRADGCLGHYFSQAIKDAATVSVGNGCYIDFTTNDGQFGIDSQSAVDTVTVRDGGAYTVSYNSSGYVRGVFVSDGGVLGVTKLATRSRTDLLRGFGSARLDGDLFIQSINIGTGSVNWDRHTKMANVPFTGTGDVIVTNGVPEYPFTVTMVNGASTATGSIKVDKVEGDAETALYFADGANWAGTVVAGNVLLTNLTDGVDAATATFGTLDLAADFNIRVWAENGVVVTNDMVNVGQYRSSGGRLSIELMSEGLEFVAGDKIVVGTIAKSSPNPAVRVGWCVKRLAIDGDDENEILVMKKGVGLQLILR